MNLHIVDMIRHDHALVLQLLKALEERDDRCRCDCKTMKHELQGHMHGEEATLYRRMERRMHERIAASNEEHNSFRKIFGRLDRTPIEQGAWLVDLVELRQAVHRHIGGEGANLEGALRVSGRRNCSRWEITSSGRNGR